MARGYPSRLSPNPAGVDGEEPGVWRVHGNPNWGGTGLFLARLSVLKPGRLRADEDRVPSCPACGHQLQTLDLPCPSCVSQPVEDGVDVSKAREFSETIHYARAIRYRPQEFVEQVNRWFLSHPGIVGISAAALHRDREGVRSITLTCHAVLDPVPLRAQVACIPLRTQLGKRLYQDPGQALTAWSDAHPQARRLNHWIFAAAGNASEVWVLYVVPADTLPALGEDGTPDIGHPRRRIGRTALEVIIAMLILISVFLALGFVVILLDPNGGTARGGDLLGVGSAAVVVVLSVWGLGRFRRAPLRRRRRPVGSS